MQHTWTHTHTHSHTHTRTHANTHRVTHTHTHTQSHTHTHTHTHTQHCQELRMFIVYCQQACHFLICSFSANSKKTSTYPAFFAPSNNQTKFLDKTEEAFRAVLPRSVQTWMLVKIISEIGRIVNGPKGIMNFIHLQVFYSPLVSG